MQNEAVSEDPVYFEDQAVVAFGSMVSDCLSRKTSSRYTRVDKLLDELIGRDLPEEFTDREVKRYERALDAVDHESLAVLLPLDAEAARDGMRARVLVCPELTISGYLAEDLFLRPSFVARCEAAVADLATRIHGIDVLVGHPLAEGGQLYNAMSWIRDGRVLARYRKQALPNYTVFDEKRYFDPGQQPIVVEIDGLRIAPLICEDIWEEAPARGAVRAGAQALLVMNASPFDARNRAERYAVLKRRAREHSLPIAYVNMVAGQDDLVFDGGSFALSKGRALTTKVPVFETAQMSVTLDDSKGTLDVRDHEVVRFLDTREEMYRALVLGTRDYVAKSGFEGVLLGLSGGIDSALTAKIAVDALGKEKVLAVMMPSQYTSDLSKRLAKEVAAELDIFLLDLPIDKPLEEIRKIVGGSGIAAENQQARLRGLYLMTVSNMTGRMLLTTGNKSELAVGYATLYGDMCGGFNVLKDVYKTTVFALSKWRNQVRPEGARGPAGRVMPERVIDKPPSAELRANQKDEDSLPPYPKLDDILECLVENEMPVEEIMKRGHDLATIKRVEHLLSIAEYKRRQAPPGVKITRKNFGRDRRYPITNAFRDAT